MSFIGLFDFFFSLFYYEKLDFIEGAGMRISMLAIGNELLEGISESNSRFLGEFLSREGFEICRNLVVRDRIEEVVSALCYLSENSDVIFISGGLGPTDDDITREAFRVFLKKELYLSDEILRKIKLKFESKGLQFHEGNEKQAFVIEGSKVFDNPVGSAPGFYYKNEKNEYFIFPGVPGEWKEMIKLYLPDFIKEWQRINGLKKFSFLYHTFGISEAKLNNILRERLKGERVSFGTIARQGIISFRLDIFSETQKRANEFKNNFPFSKGIFHKESRLDLPIINAEIIHSLGIPKEKIYLDGRCSCCRKEGFASYRRDGEKAGRMVLIALKEK